MGIAAGNSFNVRDFAPALWLDAADSSTLFDAVSGGNLVAAGGAVARWEDKSGNGRHVTQSTLANRPIRTAGVQNTRDALTFDGVNDFLNTVAFGGTQDCTYFIVAASKNSSQYKVLAAHAANFETPNPGANYIAVNASRLETATNGASGTSKISAKLSTTLNMPNNTFGVISTEFTNTHSGHIPRLNGSTYSVSNTFANDPGLFVKPATSFGVGAYNGGAFPCLCDIAEIIYFTRLLSATERQSIERYLANKWGLGFNPLSLSPALWLDAADPNTLFDATTGGNLVAAGGAVARWEDKSGNGRHATQSTVASRPIRTVAGQGGRDVIRYDGSDDFLATTWTPSSAQYTIFSVISRRGAGNFQFAYSARLDGAGAPNNGGFGAYITGGTNTLRTEANNLYINGQIQTTSESNQQLNLNTFYIIASYDLNNPTPSLFRIGGANSSRFPGDIAECIVIQREVTASERQAVERYLAQKWNIIP